MTHAFLSYARRDDEAVRRVIAELDRAGITYWVDQRDIPVSVPWFDEVREAILGSALFVVCESLQWYESQACRIEQVTAEELGKQVVHIDVVDQSPQQASATIVRSVAAQSDLDRAHTDLLVRSSAWDRAGRAKHDLAGGSVLRPLRRAGKDGNRPLTTVARSFLEASIRRHRRRAWATRLGGLVVVLAVLTGIVFEGARKKAAADFVEAATTFGNVSTIHERTERDPYDGLRLARSLISPGNSTFLARTVLQDALDIPVPDRSTELPGAPLVGFGAGNAEDSPLVIAADGHDSQAAMDWAAPVSAVAADSQGQMVAAITPDGPKVMLDSRQVQVPCAAKEVAVSAAGTAMLGVDGNSLCVLHPREGTTKRWATTSVSAVAVTDRYALVGRPSGELVVFSLAGAPIAVVPGAGAITDLAVSDGGDKVAVIRDGQALVEVRDIASGALYRAIPAAKTAEVVRFAPDGRALAIGQADVVQVWDLATGALKTRLRGGAGNVSALAWSADGAQTWAVSAEHRLTRWSWRLGKRPYDDPATWFVALSAPGPDGTLIAVTQSGALVTIDPVTSKSTPLAQTGATKVVTAVVDATRTTAVLAAAETVTLYDLGSGRATGIAVEDCTAVSAAFVPGKPWVVVACGDGDILTVDTGKADVVARKQVPYDGASAVAVGPRGEVYVSSVTGVVHQTDASLTELEVINTVPDGHSRWRDIDVSADGDTIALVGDGTGTVGHTVVGTRDNGGDWNWHTPLLPTRPGQQSRAVVINHDGSLGAIGFSDGTVQYWVPRIADPGLSYTETPGAVRGLSFTASEDNVVAVTRDGVADILPGCPSCGNADKLAADADKRLAAAEHMGLTRP